MRARISVAILLVLTLLYCWGLLWIAWGFTRAGGPIGWGLALGVGALLALSVWVTWREVLFGLAAARLGRRYDDGTAAADDADAVTGGAEPESTAGTSRDPAAARAEFEAARRAVENGPEDDWRAWYRLGLAYDACRDRREARRSVRQAIRLERGA